MQVVPNTRLEGGIYNEHERHEQHTGDEGGEEYIPGDSALNTRVAVLHEIARRGHIPAGDAERQINSYLLAAAMAVSRKENDDDHIRDRNNNIPLSWFIMPVTDAPHHSLMPDIGDVIHRVLVRDPFPCALSYVVEQSIPRFRHATRHIRYDDSQTVLLTLAMGLLLGLYQGNVKKQRFSRRASLFARIHTLLTSDTPTQTLFCKEHEEIVHLGCMEYMARIPSLYMPVQNALLTEEDATTLGFYKRIPALGDELRQWIDDAEDLPSWEDIQTECAAKVERVSRMKRWVIHTQGKTVTGGAVDGGEGGGGTGQTVRETHAEMSLERITACWDTPMLRNGTDDEYRLLGLSLGLPGTAIQCIQQEVKIHRLPRNLHQIQLESLWRAGKKNERASYLQTRWHVCVRCMITQKASPHKTRLRLDTLTHRLVCSTCLTPDPVSISLVGRVMQYKATHYYLCPQCLTVQPYHGKGEQPWAASHSADQTGLGCALIHGHGAGGARSSTPAQCGWKGGKRKEKCCVCGEIALIQTATRVDHLTGEMLEFHYCQRHAPRTETARQCVNARQMDGVPCKSKKREHY